MLRFPRPIRASQWRSPHGSTRCWPFRQVPEDQANQGALVKDLRKSLDGPGAPRRRCRAAARHRGQRAASRSRRSLALSATTTSRRRLRARATSCAEVVLISCPGVVEKGRHTRSSAARGSRGSAGFGSSGCYGLEVDDTEDIFKQHQEEVNGGDASEQQVNECGVTIVVTVPNAVPGNDACDDKKEPVHPRLSFVREFRHSLSVAVRPDRFNCCDMLLYPYFAQGDRLSPFSLPGPAQAAESSAARGSGWLIRPRSRCRPGTRRHPDASCFSLT